MSYFNSITQNVIASTKNSITGTTLAVNSYWIGTGETSLGIAGIQVTVKADQNLTVFVDQSPDNINWDITDSFNYYYSLGGNGWTIQAQNSYLRVRIQNVGVAATTYYRLQTALCPIVEAVPRSLDSNGYLTVSVEEIESKFGDNYQQIITPNRAAKVTEGTRLVGAVFATGSNIIDPNFWTTGVTNGGNVLQYSGSCYISISQSNSTASIQSVRTARYVPSYTNYWRSNTTFPAFSNTGGTFQARGGAFNSTDGFFFQVDKYTGTTTPILSVVCRNAGQDTVVTSGSFNGQDIGSAVAFSTGTNTFEIYWTQKNTWFLYNNIVLHTSTGNISALSSTPHLPCRAEVTNNGAENYIYSVRSQSISRLGHLDTQAASYYSSGQTAAQLKYGPGNLKAIIIGAEGGNNAVVTLYDGTSTNGNIITSIICAATANFIPFTVDCQNLPFYTGLYLSKTVQNSNTTIVYE